ncbi:hypothetical protein SBH91_004279, partial [Pseudomonas putida]
IKIKIKIKSRRYGRSQKYGLLLAIQQSRGADRRIVSTGSKFAPDCSCSTRRGALDCRPLRKSAGWRLKISAADAKASAAPESPQCTFFHREIDDQGTVAGHVGR